ncbi:MAG TPA: DUF1801 domain-containing protein [Bacteroidia bacterium]|nr:DUF1801 domain-containing protein [Bacteroidia bacterium]
MKPFKTTDAYLAALPEEPRATLEKIRAAVRAAAPDAEEVISYGMPAFRLNGRLLVSFSAFKNHCSFFPMSKSVIRILGDALKKYPTNPGTIRFPIGKPLPATLVKKMVKMRIRENEERELLRALKKTTKKKTASGKK